MPPTLFIRRMPGTTPFSLKSLSMNSITFQWAGVNTMPTSCAWASAIAGFHWARLVMCSSSFTSMVTPAICFCGIVWSSVWLCGRFGSRNGRGNLFSSAAHLVADARHGQRLEQHVPVNPLECALAQMVQPRFLQQRKRSQAGDRIGARHRLQVVIEVEQKCFAAARFDKAVGMSVKVRLQRFAFDEMQNVSCEHLGFEMRH